jgi:hypothetical protein
LKAEVLREFLPIATYLFVKTLVWDIMVSGKVGIENDTMAADSENTAVNKIGRSGITG